MKVTRVLETALYVHDLAAARDFYGRVLGLELHSEMAGRHVFFRCGDGMVLLFNPQQTEKPEPAGLPVHGARGPGHVAWVVTENELQPWREALRAHGVAIEQEHTWPNGARSIYFRDPSGNSLELATPSLWR